jgi:phospholipid transport system transporter-binding protein
VIRREGRRLVVSGPVTLANVAKLLEEGRQHLAEGAGTVDLGEVTEMDSALLALSLAWLRDARAAKRELAFMNPPEALQTLSRLYGVESLLPVSKT